MTDRKGYVLDHTGWDDATRLAAVRAALHLVGGEVTQAETDISWDDRDRWPEEVLRAAEWLRDHFVPEAHRPTGEAEGYLQTGVATTTSASLPAFITFAPYAFDATFWAGDREVASVNDEGASLVVNLTEQGARQLADTLGAGRLVSLEEWRARPPSALRRFVRRRQRRG